MLLTLLNTIVHCLAVTVILIAVVQIRPKRGYVRTSLFLMLFVELWLSLAYLLRLLGVLDLVHMAQILRPANPFIAVAIMWSGIGLIRLGLDVKVVSEECESIVTQLRRDIERLRLKK